MVARAAKHAKRARREAKKFIREYLELHPCVDCGEADPIVLDFDHVRGEKTDSICNMTRRGRYGIPKILAEIAKCEVRCANCHRRVTEKRRVENRKLIRAQGERKHEHLLF